MVAIVLLAAESDSESGTVTFGVNGEETELEVGEIADALEVIVASEVGQIGNPIRIDPRSADCVSEGNPIGDPWTCSLAVESSEAADETGATVDVELLAWIANEGWVAAVQTGGEPLDSGGGAFAGAFGCCIQKQPEDPRLEH